MSNTKDDYRTWQDLVDEESRTANADRDPCDRAGTVSTNAGTQDVASSDIELSPDVRQLLKERDSLKKQLDTLTGHDDDGEQDARRQAMFPKPVHTRDTRIEDRRLQRLDEENRQALQRLLERQSTQRRLQEEQQQAEEQAQKRRLEQLTAWRRNEEAARQAEEQAQRRQLGLVMIRRRNEDASKQAEEQFQRWLIERRTIERKKQELVRLEEEQAAHQQLVRAAADKKIETLRVEQVLEKQNEQARRLIAQKAAAREREIKVELERRKQLEQAKLDARHEEQRGLARARRDANELDVPENPNTERLSQRTEALRRQREAARRQAIFAARRETEAEETKRFERREQRLRKLIAERKQHQSPHKSKSGSRFD